MPQSIRKTKEQSKVMSENKIERQKRAYEELLQGNRDWVEQETAKTPHYFAKLAAGQEPDVLWIGVFG